MTQPDHTMSAAEFRKLVAELGFAASDRANDEGLSAAARFFGRGPRQGIEWANDRSPVPVYVAKMLRLMKAKRLSPDDVDNLAPRRR